MLLTDFIKTHNNWEELLSTPPYCVRIKRNDRYVMFSYNQLESDFTNELVRECRGVILNEETMKPVCVPFYKFGNYGEGYVPQIDWSSARTQEKIDGSLIKVWYDSGSWHVSTNGNICADSAVLEKTDLFDEHCGYETFGDLFTAAREKAGLNLDSLDKDCTYMFELVSPYNKVVIMYDNLDLYHIGTRNNKTLQELNVDINVKKPKEFALNSLDACVAASKDLPANKEGYVVVDKHFNRIKIKNPTYVALHHLKNNGDPNLTNFIEVIRKNETGEFLTYFPEFKSKIAECESKITSILTELQNGINGLIGKIFETQKDFALEVKNKRFSYFYFCWWKNHELTPKQWFWEMSDEKIKIILNNMR